MSCFYEYWYSNSFSIKTIKVKIPFEEGSEKLKRMTEGILITISDSIIENKEFFKIILKNNDQFECLTDSKKILNTIDNEVIKKLEIENKSFTVTYRYKLAHRHQTYTNTFFSSNEILEALSHGINTGLHYLYINMASEIEYILYKTKILISDLSKVLCIEELDQLLKNFENEATDTITNTIYNGSLSTYRRKTLRKYILEELSIFLPILKQSFEKQIELFKAITNRNNCFRFVYNSTEYSKYYTFNSETNQLDEYKKGILLLR